MPSVDIIVPCYNYGRFLHACVGSVLTQRGCEVRVLIIDDASTDDSLAVARAIAAGDPRVEVRAHAVNRGHIATYNEGIEWLTADYMLLLSSDDMLALGALARAVDVMQANPNVAFVYGTSIQFTAETEIEPHRAANPAGVTAVPVLEAGAAFIRRLCARPVNPVETATAVVRTSLQQAVGGYRSELPHAGDLEMWLRLADRGDVGILPAVQAFTRIHSRNMRHGYKAERMRTDYEQRQRAFEIFFEGRSARSDRGRELCRLARRSLAEEVLWAATRCFEETNDPAALRLMTLARNIDPSVIRRAIWWKAVMKRALGPWLWHRVAPAVAAARGQAGAAVERPATGRGT